MNLDSFEISYISIFILIYLTDSPSCISIFWNLDNVLQTMTYVDKLLNYWLMTDDVFGLGRIDTKCK